MMPHHASMFSSPTNFNEAPRPHPRPHHNQTPINTTITRFLPTLLSHFQLTPRQTSSFPLVQPIHPSIHTRQRPPLICILSPLLPADPPHLYTRTPNHFFQHVLASLHRPESRRPWQYRQSHHLRRRRKRHLGRITGLLRFRGRAQGHRYFVLRQEGGQGCRLQRRQAVRREVHDNRGYR